MQRRASTFLVPFIAQFVDILLCVYTLPNILAQAAKVAQAPFGLFTVIHSYYLLQQSEQFFYVRLG